MPIGPNGDFHRMPDAGRDAQRGGILDRGNIGIGIGQGAEIGEGMAAHLVFLWQTNRE